MTDAALALDAGGNFLAMRVRTRVNIGAYVASMAGGPATANLGTLAGTYVTPAIHVETAGVFTNTNPTCPYRGAGRPEAAYVIEQLIDAAARELDRDPVELRRRNTIPEDAMPFRTGLVFNYDAARSSGTSTAPAKRATARRSGTARGPSKANACARHRHLDTIEARRRRPGTRVLRFDPTGTATLFAGTDQPRPGARDDLQQMSPQTLASTRRRCESKRRARTTL